MIEDYWYSGHYPGQTATCMFRNYFKNEDCSIIYKAHDFMGAVSTWLFVLNHGIFLKQGFAREKISAKESY